MVPPKLSNGQTKQNGVTLLPRKGITTRSQNNATNNALLKQPLLNKDLRSKRKAEASPVKEKTIKRSALGNITNAIAKPFGTTQQQEPKKAVKKVVHTKLKPTQTTSNRVAEKVVPKADVVVPKPKAVPRVKALKDEEEKSKVSSKIEAVRRSLDLEKSDDSSLYVSALEDISDTSIKKSERDDKKAEKNEKKETPKDDATTSGGKTEKPHATINLDAVPERTMPEGVQWDFDAENWLDPFQVSHYAMDIFNYLKERECLFPIGDYMEKQVCLSRWMRSLLVDWMVEVQESFELNHETLYLAVKLVDLYLTKVTVGTETLQLLGAASLFIASKYDERIPPMVEDFLYICDGAYTQRELIRMEMSVLKVVDFDLGIPLSYRFLRRYARCAKVSMPTLTLARYILEYSLMDYSTIRYSDSKMAASALLLALQMKDLGGWTQTLEYYSGYKVDDIRDIVHVLNEGLHRKHKEALVTIRNKYSHKIFFEVAKLPLKDTLDI
ncbi:hypothetical protein KPH14_006001 [Odynerus spinipes]|uniref:G2/mitotic-specific cyclin-B3 n=1 Tax=Odynerus spinipes TaxID=1348599 RepID=A0AAD9RJG8_9HYME|nr:hypothetical protein KPH14_006001 [Odynerus spinipes]